MGTLQDQVYPATQSSGYISVTYSGIWAAPATNTIYYTKTGKVVGLYIPVYLANATTAAAVTISGIPAFLEPAQSAIIPMIVCDNNTGGYQKGYLNITAGSGTFTVNTNTTSNGGNWTGVSNVGTSGITGSWAYYLCAV